MVRPSGGLDPHAARSRAQGIGPSEAREETLGEPTFFQFLEQAKAYGGWIAKAARTFESLENRP